MVARDVIDLEYIFANLIEHMLTAIIRYPREAPFSLGRRDGDQPSNGSSPEILRQGEEDPSGYGAIPILLNLAIKSIIYYT